MKGDNTSKSSKDTNPSLNPEKIRTRAFDLLRQAAIQNDSWQLHESPGEKRRVGAGTPSKCAEKGDLSSIKDAHFITDLKNLHASAADLKNLQTSCETEYNNALKEIVDVHHKLEASLDDKYQDDFYETKNNLHL